MATWNWLHRAAIPAMWAGCEATWLCLWSRPTFGAGLGPGDDFTLPYLLAAAAMVAGTLLAAWVTPDAGGDIRWRRALVAVPVVAAGVVAVAMAASSSGSLSGTSESGWTVSVLLWARGLWIGGVEPSSARLFRSAGMGGGAFVVLFLALAADDPTFNRAVGSSAWLFMVFLCGTVGVISLAREQELEQRLLARAAAPPRLAWLAVLGLPMVVVLGGALVVALAARPVGEPVGAGVRAAGSRIDSAAGAAADWVGELFSREPGEGIPPTPKERLADEDDPFVANQGRDSSQWSIGQFLLVVLLAGVLVWGALWIAVYFRIGQFGQMARWVPGLRPRPADEERTSVFSLRSLFGRLRAFLARLFGGRRRRRAGSVLGATAGDATPLVGAPPVRREYQEMLVAAGRTDAARLPTETVLEFEDRLSPRLEPAAAALSLRRLTGLYSDVRYGERPADADSEVTASAASAAGAVIAALEALPAPESPARGPSGLGVTPAG